MNGKRNGLLDLFRAILCIAVLLYHLEVLKGGFLAVCGFLVLSGFLTTESLKKQDSIDLLQYYKKRFVRLWLPLAAVVFTTLAVMTAFPDIVWVTMKPETTSVLAGYNNFWQLAANFDYFARHSDSPFMHFWYIAIQLQFDLFFPIIFITVRKLTGNREKPTAVIYTIVALGLTALFVQYYRTQSLTVAYYHTLSRLFSPFAGVALSYLKEPLEGLFSRQPLVVYVGSLLLLLVGFYGFGSESPWFPQLMIAATLLSAVNILAAVNHEKEVSDLGIIRTLSDHSYEIYLVQYPICYLYRCLSTEDLLLSNDIIVIIILVLLAAFLVHGALNSKIRALKVSLALGLLMTSLLGGRVYLLAADNTEEMRQLQQQLAENEEQMLKEQQEAAERMARENAEWERKLAEMDADEDAIREMVSNLTVTAIGDSVMVGAANKLKETFRNCYVDAKVSRTGWVVEGILKKLNDQKSLGQAVVLHLGTNGDCPERVKDKIMKQCKGREVFWLTVTNDKNVHVNDKLKAFVEKHENAHLIDWQILSSEHPEYFYSDKIHLNSAGRKGYAQTVRDEISRYYLELFAQRCQQIIDEHEQELRTRISFFGNELLTGIYSHLSQALSFADYHSEAVDFNALKEQILTIQEAGNLAHNLIFCFDSSTPVTRENYEELRNELADNRIIIVDFSGQLAEMNRARIIDLNGELTRHPEYLSPDKLHLTPIGNQMLFQMISTALNEQ
ncbi:MAG: acyltransferase family protein [Erysipelotrichaceae bacterium]|nr:acyltransferase family protein [Erysipelotrichaceae bacterium]